MLEVGSMVMSVDPSGEIFLAADYTGSVTFVTNPSCTGSTSSGCWAEGSGVNSLRLW